MDPETVRNNMQKFVNFGAALYQYLIGIGLPEEAIQLENGFQEARVPGVVVEREFALLINQDEVPVMDLINDTAGTFPFLVQIVRALAINGPSFAKDLEMCMIGLSEIEKQYSCNLSKICGFLAFNMKAYRFLVSMGLQGAATNLRAKINLIRPYQAVADDTIREVVEGSFDPSSLIKTKPMMFGRSLYLLGIYGFNFRSYIDSIPVPSVPSSPAASGPSAQPVIGPSASIVCGSSSESMAVDIAPTASSVTVATISATFTSSPVGVDGQPLSFSSLLHSVSHFPFNTQGQQPFPSWHIPHLGPFSQTGIPRALAALPASSSHIGGYQGAPSSDTMGNLSPEQTGHQGGNLALTSNVQRSVSIGDGASSSHLPENEELLNSRPSTPEFTQEEVLMLRAAILNPGGGQENPDGGQENPDGEYGEEEEESTADGESGEEEEESTEEE